MQPKSRPQTSGRDYGLKTSASPEGLAAAFDPTRDTVDRAKAVDALTDSASLEQIAGLRRLLGNSDESELLRNNVANKLRECGDERLVADLTEMAFDQHESSKWRNYCVQHLYTCYEQAEDPDAGILDTLFKAADPAEIDERLVRICAVWSLARVAAPRDKSRLPDDEELLGRIRRVALDALREKDAHFLITTAGIQSCARLGLTGALPDIRAIAGNNDTNPTHLRVVAIAALGDLGDATDLPLLERLVSTTGGQLKGAAELAGKKVRERTANSGASNAP